MLHGIDDGAEESKIIGIRPEDLLSTVAAIDDVERDTVEKVTWWSRHDATFTNVRAD